MIKSTHPSKRVLQAARHENVARPLKRLGEPFLQHVLVLIVSTLLVISLSWTRLVPGPSALAPIQNRGPLLALSWIPSSPVPGRIRAQ